ncbi:MAG TPA: serine hydrolase [Aquabacterium sp.]|nr:serine hydrolase [Aquabacterium sp.]
MVRQKFKLRLVVGLLVSMFAVSLGFNAQAAGSRANPQTKTSAKSVTKGKSAAKASGKKVASKASKKGRANQVATKGTRQARTAMKAGSKSSLQSRQASSRKSRRDAGVSQARGSSRASGVMTASLVRTPQARAQAIPTRVSSYQAMGRTPIASPSASAATGASFGQIYGLHHTQDPLELKSSVALVIDQDTNEILLAKNSDAVLPIASLTKLMTAMVVVEARLPLDEMITITQDDVDTEKNSSSRLAVGTVLPRGEALHLALMASENRAAHALGRTFPGGLQQFVGLMNNKARQLGMVDSRYVEPTGLSSRNQSSARDLASLVRAAYQQPLIRELSVSPSHSVQVGARQVRFGNTNSLVRSPVWDIGLQKTGYIVEAGRCLVMQARMAGRKLIMVFLDSSGKYSRQADAERVRRWIENSSVQQHSSTPTLSVSRPARTS